MGNDTWVLLRCLRKPYEVPARKLVFQNRSMFLIARGLIKNYAVDEANRVGIRVEE
jgi:hypothetical protein